MNILLNYDQSMDMKVYLSTNSSSAKSSGLQQTNSIVTVNDFNKANSALVINTHDSDNNSGKVLATFEDLGSIKNLKYDSTKEMEFYVYVENYSADLKMKYNTFLNFLGTGTGFTPFGSPDYIVVEKGGASTPSKALLIFKIQAIGAETSIDANKIQIEIELDIVVPPLIYGVSRLLSATSPVWTRTDDNVGKTATAYNSSNISEVDDFAMGANGGNLDFFKDIDIVNMKVSDGEVVARLGDTNFTWGSDIGYGAGKNSAGEDIDVMTYYPGHYIKRWQDPNPAENPNPNAKEYIQLSMWDFEGAIYIEPYYRGTFEAIADTKTFGAGAGQRILRSYAGVAPQRETTIDKFRDYAKNNPNTKNKMSIGDWRDFDFLCLYLIKYANYNSQAMVGNGIVGLTSAQITGNGGAHTTLLGRDGYIGSGATATVWCLGLCNPWGNVHEFVDGITISGQWAYVCTDPSNYDNGRTSSDYGYSKLSYQNWTASDGYPGKVGYDTTNSSNQLIGFPTATGGSATAGICDKYWSASGVCLVRRGGNYNSTAAFAGAFFFDCYANFANSGVNIGCRLLKTA